MLDRSTPDLVDLLADLQLARRALTRIITGDQGTDAVMTAVRILLEVIAMAERLMRTYEITQELRQLQAFASRLAEAATEWLTWTEELCRTYGNREAARRVGPAYTKTYPESRVRTLTLREYLADLDARLA